MNKGDVVMVTSKGRDKVTGEEYTYRWFGVVIARAVGARLGGRLTATAVYDLVRDKRRGFYHSDTIEVLPQDQWPDGIHAMRAAAILLGKIDI